MTNCGVCNEVIPTDDERLMRKEDDGTIIHYHMSCEYKVKELKPCEDCGHHKRFCSECKE